MYRGGEGHESQRTRRQGYTRFLSFSLLRLHFCLSLPTEFTVDMWITEYTSSGQTDCLECLTHARAHTHSASAATEECFLHRWCEKIRHFHRDTLMKLSVASLSSSLHFNFKTPVPPPPTPPPPHCCSNSSPTLLPSPFPLLLAFYHPLVPAFFRVFTDGHGGPSSHPPSAAKASELVLPHPSALRSHQQPFPIAFFPAL